jgi:O-antigen ligase
VLYVLVASAVIHRLWRTKELSEREFPHLAAWLGLAAMIAISALVNMVEPLQAAMGTRMILRFTLAYFVVLLLRPGQPWIRSVGKVLAAIVALQIALAGAQAIIGRPVDAFLLPSERKTFGTYQLTGGTTQFWDPGERVFGTMGRYDQLGAFLALAALAVCAALYYRTWPERSRAWGYAALLGLMVTLVLTYSRSAWFGFLLGFLFLALVLRRDKTVLVGAVMSTVLIFAYAGANGLIANRLTENNSQTVVERFFEAMSAERFRGEYYGLGRVYWMYHTVATVVPAAPLFGFGPGTYGGGAVAAMGKAEVYDEQGLPFGVYGTEGYIDNNWFSLWGELGTVGLAAYLVWYVGLWRGAVRVAQQSANKETRALAAFAAASFVSVAVNASLATMLEVRTLAPYLWVLAALTVVRAQEEQLSPYAHSDGA